MAVSRLCSWICTGNTLSKYKFSLDNGRLFSPSGLDLWKPLLSGTNLPSLTCVAGKKTLPEELGIPSPPKRPSGPFISFSSDVRKDYSNLSPTERILETKKRWATLSQTEKQSYSNKYQQEFKVYKERFKEYSEKLSDEQIKNIKNFKLKEKNAKKALDKKKEKQKIKLEAERLGRPKHPGTVLTKFSNTIKVPNHSKLETIPYVADKWNKLTEKEKDFHKLEHKRQFAIYKEELKQWNQKMIERGRHDLIQKEALEEAKQRV